jgi:CDP-glycerol glycerophosphotransferase (TagB/SpsB family)
MSINTNLFQKITRNNNLHNYIIKGRFIDGDFIENYFSLFLRLKAVISGAEYFSFKNLFFYMEYVTFISLTHGINYFKTELFKTYYGRNRYHKIVISTSEKIISIAIDNGWEDNDLIKICFPKWDKFDILKKKPKSDKNISIFLFFTWRIWNKNITEEMKIKSVYFQNIIKLMNNTFLLDLLNDRGIFIIFCLHHMLEIYENNFKFNNNNVKFIKQNEIFKYIAKSSLLITDFSSIIFEFIYQKKPYIMFMPDSDDPSLNTFYIENYSNLIHNLKNDSINFMNKFFDIIKF